jgi:hypothetical protein
VELPDRHGRWPLAAAALAGPASALAWRERHGALAGEGWIHWAPLPALLWHQTEEWVLPGGFLPWFNREVAGSGADEFPITRRDGLLINVGMGWGLGLAAGLAGSRRPALSAAQLTMDAANAALHVSQAGLRRRYNPGSATGAGLFLPLAVTGIRRLWREPGRRREVAAGAAAGIAASVGLMATMRRRVSRRSPGG